MTRGGTTRFRRALLLLCAAAALWALFVTLTGDFVVRFGTFRLSSRSPQNPALLALLTGVAAWALALPGWRRQLAGDLRWLRPGLHPAILVAVAGAAVKLQHWAAGRPLWLDEQMIALNLRERPLLDLAGPLWLEQSAPFGWLALQRGTVLLLGTGEHALRLVPLLFGLGTLAVAAWVGRRWMRATGAIALVLLGAFGLWLSHYALELKPYAGDIFWALLLPALAAWTVEAGDARSVGRRTAVWWTAAAAGQWFANGALLVAPGCALALCCLLWRRHGRRHAVVFAGLGSLWLLSFGLHYLVTLRHAVGSEFLRTYWAFALPPEGAGLPGTFTWLIAQLPPLAVKPGGTGSWVTFWLMAAVGLAFGASRPLGVMFASVPLSGFVLAALGLVPLHERLALWMVPALYVGIALSLDLVTRLAWRAGLDRRWTTAVPALLVVVLGVQLCLDIFLRGRRELEVAHWPATNHQLDDRSGVQWLLRHRVPGDVLLTTRLALPALWWYGSVPLPESSDTGEVRRDGDRVLEAAYRPPGPACRDDTSLRDLLAGADRALVYFGFRFDDVPRGFDELLLESLDALGQVVAHQDFAGVGRAAIVDLRFAPRPPAGRAGEATARRELDGCVTVRPAARW